MRGVPAGFCSESEPEAPPSSSMVEADRFTYPRAQWLEGTSVKMVRVEWRTTSSPIPMKLTTMVQNCARVSFWPGLKRLPPVPSATPIRRRMSALTAVAGSVTSLKEEVTAAEAGRTRPAATAAASSAWIMRLCFIDVSP